MYKYDIPFPKDGQLTLMYDGMPLNVSKSKAYLIEKMKAHRDDMLKMGIYDKSAEYEIIDNDNNLIFKHIFQDGEAGNAKISYHKEQSDKEDKDSASGKEQEQEQKQEQEDQKEIDELFEKLAQPQIEKAKKDIKEKAADFSGYKKDEADNLDRLIENVEDNE